VGVNYRMCVALPSGVFCRDFMHDLEDGRPLNLSEHGDVIDLGYDSNTVCGRRLDGPALCWPLNPTHTEWVLSQPTVATAVAITHGTVCAVGTKGDLWCAEIGGPMRRIETPEEETVSDVLVNVDDFCLLTRGGRSYCTSPALGTWFKEPVEFSATVGCLWGDNRTDQICGWSDGADATVIEEAKWIKDRQFPLAVEIDAWFRDVCVVLADGRFDCGSSWSDLFDAPPKDGRPSDVIEIQHYGATSNCVLTAKDEVWCTGQQLDRVFGRGSAVSLPSPTKVREGVDEVSMRGGTCARARGDDWSCTKNSGGGEIHPNCGLRDGAVICRIFDMESRILDRAVEVVGEPALGCARHKDGRIWCWAKRAYDDYVVGPTRLTSLTDASLQIDEHRACALDAGGALWCWGENACGRLGTPSPRGTDCETTNLVERPTRIKSAPVASAMAVGRQHTCLLTPDGKVACIGNNSNGELGDGSFTSRDVFAEVPGLDDVRAIAANGHSTCAVLGDRSLWCWGANRGAELGNGRVLGWETYERWPTGPAEPGPSSDDEWSGKPARVHEWESDMNRKPRRPPPSTAP
jgi:hypothetical protein